MFNLISKYRAEQVVYCRDPSVGYRGIIVIHNTKLGPAGGGTRFWDYANDDDALIDALRLAQGMSYKNALAGLPYGGGKSVIIGDPRIKDRERLFRAHGRFVNSLGGRYITAEDMNTSVQDMVYVNKETKYVVGLPDGSGDATKSGDPSPSTARGVFRAIQASAKQRWGSDSLTGRTVAIQGLGSVGFNLARQLHAAGANLVVTDIHRERTQRASNELGACIVDLEEIYNVTADIFTPCALGGIINDITIPQFKFEIIAGAANNQLLSPRHGEDLMRRGILYAPDYVCNSGGVIGAAFQLGLWSHEEGQRRVDAIYDTILSVFKFASKQKISNYEAANLLAEQILES